MAVPLSLGSTGQMAAPDSAASSTLRDSLCNRHHVLRQSRCRPMRLALESPARQVPVSARVDSEETFTGSRNIDRTSKFEFAQRGKTASIRTNLDTKNASSCDLVGKNCESNQADELSSLKFFHQHQNYSFETMPHSH